MINHYNMDMIYLPIHFVNRKESRRVDKAGLRKIK